MFHAAVTGFIVAGMLGMMTALVVNPTATAQQRWDVADHIAVMQAHGNDTVYTAAIQSCYWDVINAER
jgi:hypothetical protein